jgi:hypothetical protein
MQMDVRWEKRDKRFSATMPIVEQMFGGVAEICSHLWKAYEGYQPFHDNENAAVSLLVAGAARKGLFPISEYPVDKKSWDVIQKKKAGKPLSQKDAKALVLGRADLWLTNGSRSFSFEFKKSSERATRPMGARGTRNDLEKMLQWAADDVDRLDVDEYHHALAGIIAPVFDPAKDSIYRDFASRSHLALSIGSAASYRAYFYFSGKR